MLHVYGTSKHNVRGRISVWVRMAPRQFGSSWRSLSCSGCSGYGRCAVRTSKRDGAEPSVLTSPQHDVKTVWWATHPAQGGLPQVSIGEDAARSRRIGVKRPSKTDCCGFCSPCTSDTAGKAHPCCHQRATRALDHGVGKGPHVTGSTLKARRKWYPRNRSKWSKSRGQDVSGNS